jgi:magnesium transporter
MRTQEFMENLASFKESQNAEQIEKLEAARYPVDVAMVLADSDEEELRAFLSFFEAKDIASVIEEASPALQKRIVALLGADKTIRAFSFMSSDDITDILGFLSISQRKELLQLMKHSDSEEVQILLGFDPETAGGIMTTQYIAVRQNLTIRETLQKIKLIGPKTEVIETIFVTNRQNELIGSADLRDILIAPDDALLSDNMDENIIYVYPETDQEEVSLLVSKYDLKVLPVVNKNHAILGIITPDDVIDVIVEEQTEDFLMLFGVNKYERIGGGITGSLLRRLPWLCMNLLTVFLAASVVSLYEDVIVQVVALAVAMPIVAGMGGNAGAQTLSIVIRAIALGEADIRRDWKVVFRELVLGLINGAAIGLLTGLIIYFRYNNFVLSLIICAAMIANLVIAGIFGFMVPLVLKKLKLDPAVSSSIFLTAATDVGGFFIFLGLAKLFLPSLI